MKENAQEEYGSLDGKYRRIVIAQHGGPEVLQVVAEDPPEPGSGEARVKILAAGVSAYDLVHRRSGSLPGSPRLPYTPGEDIVGVVDKLGEGVTSIEPGQRVAGYPRGGSYAESICLPAGELVPVPEGVDPAQAVCLVANYRCSGNVFDTMPSRGYRSS
jgi:NADPH:quinone reductase-like Zn-dependent oxidoreductase